MEELCCSEFWNSNLTWYTNEPDFTMCFKKTVLVWVPCAFLWIFLPLEIYYLRKNESRDIPFHYFNVIKLLFIFIIISSVLTDFSHNLMNRSFQPFAYFYSPIIIILTFALFFALTVMNIKRGIRSSAILFTFSFLCVICGIPEFIGDMKNVSQYAINFSDENYLKKLYYILYYISITSVFLLNCFVDEKPQRSLCMTPKNVYPYKEVSFLSKLFITWFDPYVWKNYKKAVKTYLWDLDSEDAVENACPREKIQVSKRLETLPTREGIIEILQKEHGFTFWLCNTLKIIYEVMTIGLYIAIDGLILSLQAIDYTWKEYLYIGLFFAVILSQTLLLNIYSEICIRLEIRMRNSILSRLYRKALNISNAVRKDHSTSDIVNLMSIDTFQLQNSVKEFHTLFSMGSHIMVSFIYLWLLLGFSVVACAVFILFVFLIIYHKAKYMKSLQKEEMQNKNIRSKLMQEIFTGIKVLKMYAWELSFQKVAQHLRDQEFRTLTKIANANVVFHSIFQNSPFLTCVIAFSCYVLTANRVMDIRTAFISLTIFTFYRVPFHFIPQIILSLQQARVSIKRINTFLDSDEIDDTTVSHDPLVEEPLCMKNASFSWISKEGPVLLHDINIRMRDSSLVAIVGPVGAGKSSLVSAFMGEMYKTSGYVNTKGSIAFAPQQAWILNTTLRENITLGEKVDQQFYENVIEACALKQDLDNFPGRDLIEIGEKGVNLSGGQKLRIGLARAICRNADIYFFDDPLSAVDTHVANHIFHHVLGSNGILKKKLRVLVTHTAKFFPFMDEIIVMENGRISETGTYEQLLHKKGDFIECLPSSNNNNDCLKNEDDNVAGDETSSSYKLQQETKCDQQINQTDESKSKNKSSHKMINEEKLQLKQINKKIYWMYVKAAKITTSFGATFLLLFFQFSVVLSNLWLLHWIRSADSFTNRYFYLSIYASFGIFQVIFTIVGDAFLYKGSVRASNYFYQKLLENVMQWSMSSFDATPIGRIIARFSDDVYILDNHVAIKIAALFSTFYRLFSIIIFIMAIIPLGFIAIIPTAIVFFIIRGYYLTLHHQLKRIESIHKSPLYSHLVETVTGIQSIRAHNLQNEFIHRCYKKVDSYSAAFHSSATCERWFCSRMEILEGLFVCSIMVLAILQKDSLDIGITCFLIVFTAQVIKGMPQLSIVLSGIEDGMVALERINEFINSPREPLWENSCIAVPSNWPNNGDIKFDGYKLRYRKDLDFVLNGISFKIKSGEKVGIVGRTGAGKSSIITGLFRLVEPTDGTIYIDGIDITKLGLQILRSKLTVIPQEPVLFSGTLRFNLDPFNNHPDEHLWNALEKSHLKNFVSGLPAGIQYMIEEGGRNLSFGQKQLICLARALLRKSKILILDEATASVDLTTDELIQSTIRQEFCNCTVITIAHRLNTLQGYDKILMLEGGQVASFDSVENIIQPESLHL